MIKYTQITQIIKWKKQKRSLKCLEWSSHVVPSNEYKTSVDCDLFFQENTVLFFKMSDNPLELKGRVTITNTV